jgi:hypothetical protein
LAKVAILNDTHCGIRNSSDIFLDNAAKFYKEVFFPYCKKHNIKNIIHLGDYYDSRKSISIKALHHNRKNFLDPLRNSGMTMDLILGNHDVFYKNTNAVASPKELLGYFLQEINIIETPRVLKYGNIDVALVPWINAENHESTLKFIQSAKADILGGHLDIIGFDLFKGAKSTAGFTADTFDRYNLVLSGHYHTKSNQGSIHYLGSQMEFFWSDAHDPKFFHTLDTETGELEAIRNPHTIFEKMYYDDSTGYDYKNFDVSLFAGKFVKVQVLKKKELFMFEEFIEKIEDIRPISVSITENFDEFFGVNVNGENINEAIEIADTQALLHEYINSTDTELNKNQLKTKISQILVEAQTMDLQ